MKKIFALILAMAMVFSFAACGEKKTDDAKGADVKGEVKKELTLVEFEPVEVINNEQCAITISDYVIDDIWGTQVVVTLENKTNDKNLSFDIASASVNGVTCSVFMIEDLEPGETLETEVSIYGENLEALGIEEFTDVKFAFEVSDSDDLFADPIAVEVVHVYPYGEENAYKFVREAQSTDVVIMDNEYARVLVVGAENEEILDWYEVYIYIENKSDKVLCLYAEEATVNGKETDPIFFPTVEVGEVTLDTCTWVGLTEMGITSVEEIEFDLFLTDYDDWVGDDLAVEHVVYNP